MERAIPAADLNLFRTRPQRAKWYLAVHQPSLIYWGRIGATPDTYPASTINILQAFNNGDPSLTARNQTVWVGTMPTASDEGELRLRQAVDTSLSIVPIAESGSGQARYYVNNYVGVVDKHRPMAIMARYDRSASQWRVDQDIAYESHLEDYGPVIRMGPPLAGFLGEDGTFTASFVGGSTQFISATYSDSTWTFPDGQTETGRLGTEASPVVKTFNNASPSGSYFSLAVTDSTGASAISRRLIYLFASRTDVPQVEHSEIVGGILSPYKTSVRLHARANNDRFPDGAEVLIFEEASYAGNATEIGGNYPFRNSTVYRGWIIDDTLTINPFSNNVAFNVQGIEALLAKTHSKDLFLAYANPPTGTSEWVEAEDLSLDRAAIMWGKYRSNVMEITDFVLASGLPMTGKIAFQDLPKGSLWSQIQQNYGVKGVNGYVSADLQGTLYATEDVQFSGGSANLPLVMHIQKQDRRDAVTIYQPNWDANAKVELYSVASTNYIGAKSPGADADDSFGTERVHQRGLVAGEAAAAGQQLLTQWAGNMRAKLNSRFPRVTVPLAGNLKLDAVPQGRITMSLSATENSRGIEWNDKQFLQTDTTLTYDSLTGLPLATAILEEVVNGKGGSAITFEKIKNTPPPAPPPIPPPPPPPPTAGDGFGTCYVFLSNKLVRTRDLSATSPTWVDITGDITGTSYDWILDPWRPSERGFALTSTGVWRVTNLDTDTPSYELVDTGFAEFTKIQASINVDGFLIYTYYTGGGPDKLYARYSTNAGDDWTSSLIADATFIADNRVRSYGALDVVPHLVDGQVVVYVATEFYKLASTQLISLYKSSDGGATWTNIKNWGTDGTPELPYCVNTPYNNNEDGKTVWVSMSYGTDKIYKTTDGSTWTAIDPSGAGITSTSKRLGIEIWVQNQNAVAIWGSDNNLYITSNGGTTWSQATASGYNSGTMGVVSGAGGFPSVYGQYYVVTANRYVLTSTDLGETFTDKSGNIRTIITSNDPGVTGGGGNPAVGKGVVVPDWTE